MYSEHVYFFAVEMKSSSVGGQDEWSVREKLILASSVMRSGDQNWY